MSYRILKFSELNSSGLESKIEKAQEILSSGNWNALDVKKLKDKNLYRAKLGDSDRLLFRIGQRENKKCVLLLEVIKSHNYARSRFLRGFGGNESEFHEASPDSLAGTEENLAYINEENRFQILDKIISFNEAQAQVFALPLPLIIIGSAGSGKTALMLEKMKLQVGEGLYVTHSKFLAENSRRIYYSNHYENDSQEIEFLSFKEFLQSIEIPKGKEIHYPQFLAWWERHRMHSPVKDPRMVFEEFRGVLTGTSLDCAFLSKKEYLELGVKQSIFPSAERNGVYGLFERYLQYLSAEGGFEPNIISFHYLNKAVGKYDFVVVDEAQDLTNIQIRLILKQLKNDGNWLLCGDSNQIVHPNFFSWARVKSMFYQSRGESPREILRVLNDNFRNSHLVTALANRILLLKNKRFGSIDKESNFLVTSMSGEKGTILRLKSEATVLADLDQKTHKSTRFAVVVPNEAAKEKAKAYFKTPLIFTVYEAKGLEYKTIVVFDFVSEYQEQFDQISAGVDSIARTDTLAFSRGKDKSEKSLEVYKFFINSLYVAITRAVDNLILIESTASHRVFELLDYPSAESQFEWKQEESNLEEWRSEARRLESQGKIEQARQIQSQILGEKKPVPWKVMDEKTFSSAGDLLAQGKTGKIDKAERQWLYQFSLVHRVKPWQRVLERNLAKNAEQVECTTIRNKFFLDYLGKSYGNLEKKFELYGIDFPSPFGWSPLHTAAHLGIAPLIEILMEAGARPELFDFWGRSALGLCVWNAVIDAQYRAQRMKKTYEVLSRLLYRFQSRQKLWQLSSRPFEYFLFQRVLAHYYRGVVENEAQGPSYFVLKSEKILTWVGDFEDAIVPDHRKNRTYLSSILSKNEIGKDDPYNRGLFVRLQRGEYLLNPRISFEVSEDEWVPISAFLHLEKLERLGFHGAQHLMTLWGQHL